MLAPNQIFVFNKIDFSKGPIQLVHDLEDDAPNVDALNEFIEDFDYSNFNNSTGFDVSELSTYESAELIMPALEHYAVENGYLDEDAGISIVPLHVINVAGQGAVVIVTITEDDDEDVGEDETYVPEEGDPTEWD